MKKILLSILGMQLSIIAFSQCQCSGSLLIDDYSNVMPTPNFAPVNAWTQDNNGVPTCGAGGNGTMQVDMANSNELRFVSVKGGRQNRIYRSIPMLNNQTWTADFEFTPKSPYTYDGVGCSPSSGPAHTIAAFTAGSSPLNSTTGCPNNLSCTSCGANGYPATNMDAIWVNLEAANWAQTNTSQWWFKPYARESANTPLSPTSVIFLPAAATNQTFYIRIQRISSTQGILSVCTDNVYTQHLPNSPLCFSIPKFTENLNTLQHGVLPQAYCGRVLNATVDNMKIANTVECGMSLSASFTAPTDICDGQPITVDGTATTGSPWQETDYIWEITEFDPFGFPTGNSWNQQYTGQVGQYTFPSAANGGPNFIHCGKHYYVVKLTAWHCGVVQSNFSRVINIRCNPQISIEAETEICQGESVILTASGGDLHYWIQPISAFTNPVTVTPTGTTTYGVMGWNSYGCGGGASITVNVIPNVDISTGLSNTTGNIIGWGQPDDTWKMRGLVNNYNNGPYANLPWANVVQPYTSWCSNWQWISHSFYYGNPNFSNYIALNEPSTISSTFITNYGTMADYYWYEAEFYVDPTSYNQYSSQLVFEIDQIAADNSIDFFLNGNHFYINTALCTTNVTPSGNYTTCTMNPALTNFSSNYIISGLNKLEVRIRNGQPGYNDSFQAFMLQGRITGCSDRSMSTENSEGLTDESSFISVYPSPNFGEFTISIQSPINANPNIYLLDLSGRILHTQSISLLEGLNQIQVSKPGLSSGVYFIRIDGFDEQVKVVITK